MPQRGAAQQSRTEVRQTGKLELHVKPQGGNLQHIPSTRAMRACAQQPAQLIFGPVVPVVG
jgi:hypothetical protein